MTQFSRVFCCAPAALLVLVSLGALSGCSSRPAHRPAAADAPARSTASAEPGRRLIRPIPDVITKPKPFRMPDTVGVNAHRLDLSATMAAEVGSSVAGIDPIEFPLAAAPAELPAAPSAAQPAAGEIRDMMRSYLRAFNRHDAAALAAHWSESGENLDLDSGEKTSGREAVADVFAALFAEDDAAMIDIDIASIKPLRDDVALVDGVSLISFADDSTASSRFSAVVTREGDRWVLSSVREAAAPVPERPKQPLDALEWLVGAWEDVNDGLTASTHCTWSAGRAFLVRSHVVTPDASTGDTAGGVPALLPAEGATREIAEIIGWDPQRGRIRSWVFSSDGRFAEGTWERSGDGEAWTVRFTGQGADAGATCTQAIRRVGADGMVAAGDDAPLSAAIPPASDFVRTAVVGE